MADQRSQFSIFQGIYIRFDIRIDIYDHQILQAATSTGFDSNEAIQTIAGDVITSR